MCVIVGVELDLAQQELSGEPWRLPRAYAEELLHAYGDVLRRGYLRAGSTDTTTADTQLVEWSTHGPATAQLDNFCKALFFHLLSVMQLSQIDDRELALVAYWFCKSVSGNYVIFTALQFLSGVFDEMVTITNGDIGSKMEYTLDVCADTRQLTVGINWQQRSNVICAPRIEDDDGAAEVVMGTLHRLVMSLPICPTPHFVPRYLLQLTRAMPERKGLCELMAMRRRPQGDFFSFTVALPFWEYLEVDLPQ